VSEALPTVCAALCGTDAEIFIRNKELIETSSRPEERFMMVRQPTSMTFSSSVCLPAIKTSIIKEINQESVSARLLAQSFIDDLSGRGEYQTPPGKRGKYSKPYALIDVSKNEFDSEDESKTWLYHYVRSRCSLADLGSRGKPALKPH
jgi:hypothetical protein